jgi:hypothetical protein
MSNVGSQSDMYEIGDCTPVLHNSDLVECLWTSRSRVGRGSSKGVPRTLGALFIECHNRFDLGEPSSPDAGDSPAGNGWPTLGSNPVAFETCSRLRTAARRSLDSIVPCQ